jgi:hypothetical protein
MLTLAILLQYAFDMYKDRNPATYPPTYLGVI